MIKVGIIGSTGYAGAEIVRLIQAHPEAEVVWYGSRSYIDENYSDLLSESYEGQFTNDEFAYIHNLREEREPNLKLKIEHFHSVERKILPYKWTNASVLNNDILSNALKNEQTEKIKKIIKAIINYSRLYKKNDFLEQYVNSIINRGENR